jgi:hypothetical protein
MKAPEHIDGFKVLEYGYFPKPILPTGYVPPSDGRPPFNPVQNIAICQAEGVDGYYLLFCTPDWLYITYCFYETIEYTKKSPLIEFGQDVTEWHKRP